VQQCGVKVHYYDVVVGEYFADLLVENAAQYPMAPTREQPSDRAILDRQIVRIDDLETEPGLNPITAKSTVVIPLVRGDAAIGALALNPSSRIRRPKAVFLATGPRYQLIFHSDSLPQQLKTAVVKTYPIPMP
jgi:hypothetical protein